MNPDCQACGGTGWILIENPGRSAAKPCQECRNDPRPSVGGDVSEEDAGVVAAAICDALRGPATPMGQVLIAQALKDMCHSKAELWWLAKRAISLHVQWSRCGVPGLRQILCSKYVPKDGIMLSYTEEFPEGIPSEIKIEAPSYLKLPPGQTPAEISKEIEQAAKLLPQMPRVPRMSIPPVGPDGDFEKLLLNIITAPGDRELPAKTPEPPPPVPPEKRITQADIDRARKEHLARKAMEEGGDGQIH